MKMLPHGGIFISSWNDKLRNFHIWIQFALNPASEEIIS
ncbi:hypothetical protein FHS76_000725 [Ochrobactrum daejeonense]|uniref:Uncharacterized protein n=1 Tax=Brucella daejeonensis TaxID=659015 RepID=A0A7W9AUX3_9HYPH|nr:hypothetical protein [Brucella daejeonensis]